MYTFLNSDELIILFKAITLFSIVIVFLYMQYQERSFYRAGRLFITGILVIILGLLNTLIWDVNYMVISCGLMALSGAFLVYGSHVGKYIYLTGLGFLGMLASVKYGFNSKGFFTQILVPTLIGIGIVMQNSDYPDAEYARGYEYTPKTEEELKKQRAENARIQQKMENSSTITRDKVDMFMKIFAFTLFTIMIILLIVRS